MSTKYVRGEETPFYSQHARQKQSANSRKTIFLLVGGGFILLLIVVVVVVMLSGKNSLVPVAPSIPPMPTLTISPTTISSPTPLPSSEPSLMTINGVAVHDFMTEHPETMPNGAYLLERTDDFQIVYDPKTSLFSITILNANIVRTRARAEERFLTILEIGEDEVCPLPVEIATPASVNKAYEGLVFKFSKCE